MVTQADVPQLTSKEITGQPPTCLLRVKHVPQNNGVRVDGRQGTSEIIYQDNLLGKVVLVIPKYLSGKLEVGELYSAGISLWKNMDN